MTVYQDPKQLRIPHLPPPVSAPDSHSSFNDPAFASNKELPIHRWVPWIAGFSSHFVQSVIEENLPAPGTVLDPFAGVGTTLVESVRLGNKAVGFEINPYAALACRTKLSAALVPLELLADAIKRFTDFYLTRSESDQSPRSQVPAGFRTRSPFYSPTVLRKVLIVQDFITTIEAPLIKDFFRIAFAATMVSYSNYSYEPSLGRRVSAGKQEIDDYKVGNAVITKLEAMLADCEWLQANHQTKSADFDVIQQSCVADPLPLEKESVDLIVTSPPYVNNYHYNRNTRPHLYWLGFANSPKDFKPLELENFGKYWQTVRDKPDVDLAFQLPQSDLEDRLAELRNANQEKRNYSGRGWANYATTYFNDCFKLACFMRAVLKPGGIAAVVLGNSILQGIHIPTDRYFGEIAELAGMQLDKIEIPRDTRVGNSIIQSEVRVTSAKPTHRLYEAVVQLRNP